MFTDAGQNAQTTTTKFKVETFCLEETFCSSLDFFGYSFSFISFKHPLQKCKKEKKKAKVWLAVVTIKT